MKKALEILLYLWQLPQNLLGLLLILILGWVIPIDMRGNNHSLPSSLLFLHSKMKGGISLGRYIILAGRYDTDINTWYHERGHSIQSMILGPLYILVIGLPSLIHAAFYRYDAAHPDIYYRFFTEKWADRLGGVNR